MLLCGDLYVCVDFYQQSQLVIDHYSMLKEKNYIRKKKKLVSSELLF